jgi:hypothetical protein
LLGADSGQGVWKRWKMEEIHGVSKNLYNFESLYKFIQRVLAVL